MRKTSLLLLALLLALSLGYPVRADSAFYVVPKFTEKQKESTGYFYLHLDPGQTDRLSVDIANPTDQPITVVVELLDAISSPVGEVDYVPAEQRDTKTTLSVTDVATLDQSEFTLAVGASAQAIVDVAMPLEPFSGEILGGLRFSVLPDTNAPAVGGVRNVYAYLISLRIEQGDLLPPLSFSIESVAPHTIYGQNAVRVDLYNQAWRVVKDASLTFALCGTDGAVTPYVYEIPLRSFAPASVMAYEFAFPRENLPAPGSYVARVTLTAEEESWHFESPFELPPEE